MAADYWPDHLFRSKESAMLHFAQPFHTVSGLVHEDETPAKGTILHEIIHCRYVISQEMLLWLVSYYKDCLVVENDDGLIPLAYTVLFANSNRHAYLVKLFLRHTPAQDRMGVIFGFSCTTQNMDVLHVLLDYSTDADVEEYLSHIENQRFVRSMLEARRQCKRVAAIVRKRRLIAGNKDVSWLVSQHILATRMSDAWIAK